MKGNRTIPSTVSAAGLLLIVLLAALVESPAPRRTAIPEIVGTKDDPLARIRHELLRMRDPATGRIPPNIRARELVFAARLPRHDGDRDPSSGLLTETWTFRGPANVGGRTRALAIDVSDPNARTLLAGGVSGGMWRTTDDGESWTLTNGGSVYLGATCIAQDRRAGHTDTWYYGTGESYGNSASVPEGFYYGQGVFKSTDGGASWSQLPSTAQGSGTAFDTPFDTAYNLATDPSNAAQEEVYAALYGSIQRSTDGGTSWTSVLGTTSSPMSYFTDVAITSAGVAYATLDSQGPAKGIYRSTDGVTWTNITPPAFPSNFGRTVLASPPSDETILYVVAAETGTASNHSIWKYRYLSGDGSGAGGIWEDRSGQLLNFTVSPYNSEKNFNSQGGYDLIVAVKPDNPDAVFIGGVDLFRSTDAFATNTNRTWIGGWLYPNWTNPVQHADQHALVFSPANPNVAYSGSDGGVWKTQNVMASQVAWTSLNNDYRTTQFYTIATDHAVSGSATLVGGLQDNGTSWTNSLDPAESWIEQFSGDGCFCAIADGASAGGHYYLSAQLGWIYRIWIYASGQQSATNWTRVDPAGVDDSQHWFVTLFTLDPADTKVMYLGTMGAGVWRNSDLTAIPAQSENKTSVNWTDLTSNEQVTALGVSRTPAHVLYYAAYPSRMYKIENAHTALGGTTPVDITDPSFPADAFIAAVAVDPHDADRVLLSFSNYSIPSLFHTSDGGSTWTSVEGNLGGPDGPSTRGVAILPTAGGNLYFVGTTVGLYSTSTLNGASTVWQQEGAGTIGRLVVDGIVSREADGLVAAASHGGGVFTANFQPTAPECATRAGDANGDDAVNVLDVVGTVNDILQTNPLGEGARACADMDGDGSIDVLDLVQIVNVILNPGGQVAPLAIRNVEEAPGQIAWNVEEAGSFYRLHFDGARAGGLQLRLAYDPGRVIGTPPAVRGAFEATSLAWSASGGMYTVLLYNHGGGSLSPGWIGVEIPADVLEGDRGDAESIALLRAGLLLADPQGRPLALEEDPVRSVPGGPVFTTEWTARLEVGPTPSAAGTRISYLLGRDGAVHLTVFDLTGRRIRTLRRAHEPAGPHAVIWDGKNDQGARVAVGTYIVLLRTSEGEQSRKATILR